MDNEGPNSRKLNLYLFTIDDQYNTSLWEFVGQHEIVMTASAGRIYSTKRTMWQAITTEHVFFKMVLSVSGIKQLSNYAYS